MSDSPKEIGHFEFLKRRPLKYLISFGIVSITSLIQYLIYPWIEPSPYVLFYPAVIIATIYGDGVAAVILSAFSTQYFFNPPYGTIQLYWPNDYFRTLLFIGSAYAISRLTHAQVLSKIRYAALVQNLEVEKNMREQFVATLTHDLRNPISAASVSAQLYLRHPEKADVGKIMRRVLASTERADRMIKDLLDTNTIKAGQRLNLPLMHCDLLQIGEEVVEEKSLKVEHPGRIHLSTRKPVHGFWNPDAIRRILENLIDNALKYGDDQKPVTVDLFCDQATAHLVVHNYGDPLSEEDMQRIFQAFGRAHFAKISGKQGWGLGLTLVRGLAEAHGGIASVESGEHGTTFTVKLPMDSRSAKRIES